MKLIDVLETEELRPRDGKYTRMPKAKESSFFGFIVLLMAVHYLL